MDTNKTILEPGEMLIMDFVSVKNHGDIPLIIDTKENRTHIDIELYGGNDAYEMKIISAKIFLSEIKQSVSLYEFKKIVKRINKRMNLKLKMKDV